MTAQSAGVMEHRHCQWVVSVGEHATIDLSRGIAIASY